MINTIILCTITCFICLTLYRKVPATTAGTLAIMVFVNNLEILSVTTTAAAAMTATETIRATETIKTIKAIKAAKAIKKTIRAAKAIGTATKSTELRN